MQRTISRTTVAASLLALVFALPGIARAGQAYVIIGDDFFSPSSVTIAPGDSIVWHNNGASAHSIVMVDGSLDSGSLQPGQNFSATFNGSAGTYRYYDRARGNASGAGMAGTIVVSTAQPPQTVTTPPVYTTASSNTSASASTIAGLQAQVQQLLAQIQAMQGASGQGSTLPTSTVVPTSSGSITTYSAACPQIGGSLGPGDSGDDVSRLQRFLASDPSVYPEALITGYYGSLTQAAVQRWQAKFNIVSSGDPATTGYGRVGPRTAAAIAIVCAGGTYNGVSASSGGAQATGPVGGYISVTPVSGQAPLTVNVSATVNTTGSCAGATYLLSYGDGTVPQQIPVASGNCGTLQQTFTHVYLYGGTYSVTLSAGSHTTSATVTVAGTPAPGGSSGSGSSSNPVGTITAFTTSGKAPLNVTFYVSCVSGVAYNVVFGDGTDLGGSNVGKTTCNGDLQSVTHTYTLPGNYQATLVLFVSQSNGTIGNVQAGSVQINASGPTQPAGTLTASIDSGRAPLSVTFTGSASDYAPCDGASYTLSYGDGQTGAITVPASSSCGSAPYTLTHTYSTAGTYTAKLTDSSGSTVKTVTISVLPASGSSGAYGSPILSSGGSSLSFSLKFDLPSSCTGYDLSWGDGTTHNTQSDGGSSCSQGTVTKTFTHTYSATGSYTITLKRGADLSRIDDLSVTISQ